MFSLLAFLAAAFTAYKLIPSSFSKFDAEKTAETFAPLGGNAVRYYVGVAEFMGPIFLFHPLTAVLGFILIASVMLGAIYLHLQVWHNSAKNAFIVLGSALAATLLQLL